MIEWKRTCKACEQIWHISPEDYNKTGGLTDSVIALGGTMSNNHAARQQAIGNMNSQDARKDAMNTCPKCGSKNFTQVSVDYDKGEDNVIENTQKDASNYVKSSSSGGNIIVGIVVFIIIMIIFNNC